MHNSFNGRMLLYYLCFGFVKLTELWDSVMSLMYLGKCYLIAVGSEKLRYYCFWMFLKAFVLFFVVLIDIKVSKFLCVENLSKRFM